MRKSLFVAASLVAGCYGHVAHPGQVRVVEYGPQGATGEVSMDDFSASDGSQSVWVEASASYSSTSCSPVTWTVRRDTPDGAAVADGTAITTARSTIDTSNGTVSVDALAGALSWPPLAITAGDQVYPLRDEHLYNLRAFVFEMRCPDTESP